ncbi:MAG: hypothetical protein RBS57_03545, partial [Desulforhabdus sp.]|nr:hypothetical protein [Desulforhabdus sp.]
EQRASEEIPRARQQESDTAVILGDLLGTITVPQRAGKIFSDLYYRHEAEIHHILNENLFLVLQTIGLVADALPTLRLMSERNGELLLDSATYARANNLYEEFRGLAGPQLTADLEETRSYLDRRTTKKDSGEVLINLNE